MKYKQGNKVRVRTGLKVGKKYDGLTFCFAMLQYDNLTITNCIESSNIPSYRVAENCYSWTNEMLEPLIEIPEKYCVQGSIHALRTYVEEIEKFGYILDGKRNDIFLGSDFNAIHVFGNRCSGYNLLAISNLTLFNLPEQFPQALESARYAIEKAFTKFNFGKRTWKIGNGRATTADSEELVITLEKMEETMKWLKNIPSVDNHSMSFKYMGNGDIIHLKGYFQNCSIGFGCCVDTYDKAMEFYKLLKESIK